MVLSASLSSCSVPVSLWESLLCSLLCIEGDAAVSRLEGSTLPACYLAWLLLREEYLWFGRSIHMEDELVTTENTGRLPTEILC